MFCAIARALRSGGGPRAASRRRPSLVARSMADGPAKLVVDPETGEEMSKNALKKLLKKRDIAARKAASAAEKAARRGGGAALPGGGAGRPRARRSSRQRPRPSGRRRRACASATTRRASRPWSSTARRVAGASPPPTTFVRVANVLPFAEDAASGAAIEASQTTERPFASVGQEARLDYRWLDLRTPAQGSVMRVQAAYPSEPVVVSEEPVVIHFADAIAMLRDSGVDVEDDYGDLSGADARAGALVKEQHGVDFFVGIDPGAEDLSPSLKSYMTAFEHGAPPHAGCGFGLARVVFLYLGLYNIRRPSSPDPKRCAP
ncbi:hypothetical protein JL720_17136 [Aureococcus anophagefferens]|nr:hypothetical protein JL720_17136 [Aureococcus anophagefferens]